MFAPSSYSATMLVQTIYTVLGFSTLGTAVALPWLSPCLNSKTCPINYSYISASGPDELHYKSLLVELRNCSLGIGWTYICSWCLLQLLLQQPINSMPILLLLLQVLVGMLYCFYSGEHNKHWVEVSFNTFFLLNKYVLFVYVTNKLVSGTSRPGNNGIEFDG